MIRFSKATDHLHISKDTLYFYGMKEPWWYKKASILLFELAVWCTQKNLGFVGDQETFRYNESLHEEAPKNTRDSEFDDDEVLQQSSSEKSFIPASKGLVPFIPVNGPVTSQDAAEDPTVAHSVSTFAREALTDVGFSVDLPWRAEASEWDTYGSKTRSGRGSRNLK